MNDIAELKRFIVGHLRAQGIPDERYSGLLTGITHDRDGAPGSWAHELTSAADALADEGRLLEACQFYAMARFPYPDGPGRRTAAARCVATFDAWRRQAPVTIEPLDVPLPEGRVRCWTTGLSRSHPRPLLILLGGIVSPKEQWGPLLVQIEALGMAGVVTELPGVGENTLPYGPAAWSMLPELVDAVSHTADTSQTYVVALSFSGHLALRAAIDDSRLKGIVGAGTPVRRFFTDPAWQRGLPRVTTDTIAHLTGTPADLLPDILPARALTPAQLAAVPAQVGHVTSERDEIVPPEDAQMLRRHLRTLSHDDVHGSPRHLAETRLWTFLTVLRMRRDHTDRRTALHQALLDERSRKRALEAPA
ncbi:alpha/beta hydrolase [Streptomyces sp. NPDC026589]|uniref:alpha/beta hydrolase n=1 Tax=Streptomyces sp. NPDC026589 TaxID=3155609 RepID=UPI0033E4837F